MLLQLVLFTLGLGVLYVGAEGLIRGASAIARRRGIRTIIIGVTVVALGTSMPEFVVNFFALLTGENDLALGNVIGSNIMNVALILGVSSLIVPLLFPRSVLRREYPFMMGSLLLFYVLALDGVISRGDGLLLVACLIGFMLYIIRFGRSDTPLPDAAEPDSDGERYGPAQRILYVVGGVALLAAGARLMVYSATNLALMFGITPIVIGLTVVAIGTSLPELAASIVSLVRGQTDLSIGNVIGSNLLNVLFVIGVLSVFSPLEVETSALEIHFPVMLLFSVLLLPMAWTGRRINRLEGGILFFGFVAYLIYLIMPYL